jgi:hypothetical protein
MFDRPHNREIRDPSCGTVQAGRQDRAGISRKARLLCIVGLSLVGAMSSSATALAVVPTPGLTVHTAAFGGEFPEVGAHTYQITVMNAGGEATPGPVVVKDQLPLGFTAAISAFELLPAVPLGLVNSENPEALGAGGCSEEGGGAEAVAITCTYPEALASDEGMVLDLSVTATAGAQDGLNTATATAPGSAPASISESLAVGSASPSFGPSNLVSDITGVTGEPDHQAGDHPYEMTTRIDLNSVVRIPPNLHSQLTSVEDVKDVVDDLPVGLVGDAQATPKCTFPELSTLRHCPADTRVGQIRTDPYGTEDAYGSIFNMVPEHGVAAEFGFYDALKATHVFYANVAPTPAGYVVRATSPSVAQVNLTDINATFFGDPATKDNDQDGETHVAFLTNPSDCSSGQPGVSAVHLDSWQKPGAFNDNGSPAGEPLIESPNWASTTSSQSESSPVTGCNLLHFGASVSAKPSTEAADSPAGLDFDLNVPQAPPTPGSYATPPLRDATVVMPPGLATNPAFANGLQACSEAQIGWLGAAHDGSPLSNRGLTNFTAAAPSCPEASRIGSVEVLTPLLENPVVGSVYLATQNANPFGAVLAAYIVIDDPTTGTIVKVPGKLETNAGTGQITGVFEENPQLPFSDFKLRFFGNELATPESCGTYTTTGQLTPWSYPESGPPAGVASNFAISGGCAPGFAPSFAAATSSPQAGGYSPLTLSFSREDNEQEISGLTVTLPPGLTAKLAGVAKCPEAALQAAEANPSGASEIANPSCPAGSEVGTVEAGTGVGSQPLFNSGKAYLAGSYKGAPLSLAVIVPAVAGPFDLGNVVVRTALHIDPSDGHVTAVSDPFPTIVHATGADGHQDGFPVRMRSVTVHLNRNTYVLNPTNCSQMTIAATLTSTGGATSSGSSRFQAGGCRELPFKPGFAVGTQGHASKANGTSLKVHVTSSFGQANIAKVKVTLPKQLPSRLTTLQKACLDSVFEANPAACPEGSVVGTAVAHTPLLEQPFVGPAYLVSHGGAAFPDLEYVLQSEGIKLILDGKTDIKKGITTSTFETVPDAPVSSFESNFPAGPHSILGTYLPVKANYNLCGQALTMPTIITGQNGAVVKQTTKITINGCPKPAKKHKAKKHKAKHAPKKH